MVYEKDSCFDCSDDEVFRGFENRGGQVTPKSILHLLHASGIHSNDPRLQDLFQNISQFDPEEPLSTHELLCAAKNNLTLLHQISCRELVIADFEQFAEHITLIYELVLPDITGKNAGYIPVLRDADPEKFGVAFCSVDGQFLELGDSRTCFTIQSTSKPLNFSMAVEKLTSDSVLKWVGTEPSGRPFDHDSFLPDGRPFNPMVNSGAMMTAATLASAYPELLDEDLITGGAYAAELWSEIIKPLWTRLTGGGIFGDIGFSEETFLSERRTADNNHRLAHLMKSGNGLPPNVHTQQMVDFYLRGCSTTTNTAAMSVMSATMANGGRNPYTNEQVLSVDTVKKALSVMTLCGFYDNTGQFFYDTGVPSKSGVSGVVFLVLPNVGGFAIFSPRLDQFGNSVRGTSFSKKLVELFRFHSFDNLSPNWMCSKLDPRFSMDFSRKRKLSRMRWALRAGDVNSKRFEVLLLKVCVRVALIDGMICANDVEEIRRLYYSVMDSLLERERVIEVCDEVGTGMMEDSLEELVNVLNEEMRTLDYTQKELLLDFALKVSIANGWASHNQKRILYTLASVLRVPEIVVDFKLYYCQKYGQGKCHNENKNWGFT